MRLEPPRAQESMVRLLRTIPAATARAYYKGIVGGARIERELDAGERLLRSPADLRTHVALRLQALLSDVALTVPFYRRLGVDLRSTQQREDLVRLPVVTRETMQATPADFAAEPMPKGSMRSQTGGSSGTPLGFWLDPEHRARMRASIYRGYRWCGHRPGSRVLFLWGSDYDARAHNTTLGRLLDRFGYNRRWANAFSLGAREFDAIVAAARVWRPEFLVAYTMSALLLARSPGAEDLAPLRGVEVTAELLTPTVRQELEATLRAPVFNRYGCREVGNIAHECEFHDGLHVFEDMHALEILDDEGRPLAAGTPGRIVVTNLTSRATPFIRYDLGDIGRLEHGRCRCGREGSRLHLLEGRVGEIVTSPGGKWIHGEFFTHLFYKVAGVRRFRVVQEDLHNLCIQIECDGGLDESARSFLEDTIHAAGDPGFRVRFEEVAHLEASPSGKFRFVESRVPLRVTA